MVTIVDVYSRKYIAKHLRCFVATRYKQYDKMQ